MIPCNDVVERLIYCLVLEFFNSIEISYCDNKLKRAVKFNCVPAGIGRMDTHKK